MATWKGLPRTLDPRLRQLVVRLREHKDRKGLSIAALEARTGFGKSSWDRYLNGRSVPPAQAVEALALACETDAAPLLELRELAAAVPAGEELEAAPAEPAAPGKERQLVPWLAVLATSVTTAVLTVLGLLLVAPWDDAAGTRATAGSAPLHGSVHPELGVFAYHAGTEYECQVERDVEDGLLYAGYSRTLSAPLQRDASGWTVVELQCLLTHHGLAPGVVDGAFGNRTERAVRRFQDRAEIAVDGIAGPDTWKVLRK